MYSCTWHDRDTVLEGYNTKIVPYVVLTKKRRKLRARHGKEKSRLGTFVFIFTPSEYLIFRVNCVLKGINISAEFHNFPQ